MDELERVSIKENTGNLGDFLGQVGSAVLNVLPTNGFSDRTKKITGAICLLGVGVGTALTGMTMTLWEGGY